MLKEQNNSNSFVQSGDSLGSLLDKNSSEITGSRKSVKIDIKASGKLTFKQLIEQNSFLKQKVKELQQEIRQLRSINEKKSSLLTPFKKASGKIQVFNDVSVIKIQNVSSMGSLDSPAIKHQQDKLIFQKSQSQDSIRHSKKKEDNAKGVQVFDDSQLVISLGDSESDATKNKNKKLQNNLININDAINEKNQTKNMMSLRLKKSATFDHPLDSQVKPKKQLCEHEQSQLEIACMDSDQSEIILEEQGQSITQTCPKNKFESSVRKCPQIQARRQIQMIISLPRSDLNEWIDQQLNNQVVSQYDGYSQRDSYLEQSSVFSKLIVSNQPSKQSVKGFLHNSRNTEKSVKKTEKKKIRETMKCEDIDEEDENEEKEEKEDFIAKRNRNVNSSLNLGHQKLLYTSVNRITEENSDAETSKNEEDVISKSLASGCLYRKSRTNDQNEGDDLRNNPTVNSDKSTYQNSQNTGKQGCLRSSSLTEKLTADKSEERKLKKSFNGEKNKSNFLEQIQESSNMEPKQNEQVFGSLKKSKSSHNLQMAGSLQPLDQQKYQLIISKLVSKIKSISIKNKELRLAIHRLRHDFYNILVQKRNEDKAFRKKKGNDKKNYEQYLVQEPENCSFERCSKRKIPHPQEGRN